MAEIKKTIKPSGGDYTSLEACMHANEQNLVTGGNYFLAEIDGDWSGGADTTAVSINGWTTAAANYISIYTTATARHDGKWNTNKYILDVFAGDAIYNREKYVYITGLQIEFGSSDNGTSGINNDAGGGTYDQFASHNIIRGVIFVLNSTNYGILGSGSGNHYYWNNIIYDVTRSGQANMYGIYSGQNCWHYNNTIYNCSRGIRQHTRPAYAKNNLVNDCQYSCYYGGGIFHATSKRNVGNDPSLSEIAWGATADSGTTDGASAGKLIDAGQNFETTVRVGMMIKNTSDTTYTYVTAVDSDSQLSVNDDIFPSGKNYTIYENMFGSVTFENEGADDFHLDSADTVAMGKWDNVYGDSAIAVTDDIDGDARPNDATGDIGADEYLTLDVTVTPAAASAIASRNGPTVILGSLSITPTPTTAIASRANPGIILGSITLTPTAISAIASRAGPTIIHGSIIITPTPISAIGSRAGPTLIFGSMTITPPAISAIAGNAGPTVVLGSLTITPGAVSAIAAIAGPSIILGSIVITPSAISAIGGNSGPVIILGSLTITPTAISAIGATYGPTVILGGDVIITPEAASAIASRFGPDVILGSLTIAPTAITAISGISGPSVILGSLNITPTPISAIGATSGPTIILGSLVLTPDSSSAIAAVFGPTVLEGGNIIYTPEPAAAIASKADPTVILGSLTVTPGAVAAVGATSGPTIIHGSLTLSPDAAAAVASGVDPSVIYGSIILTPGAAAAIAAINGPVTILGSLILTPSAASAIGTTSGGFFAFAIEIENVSIGNLDKENMLTGALFTNNAIFRSGLIKED